jgi:phosphoglycolate phosphatase
LRSAIDQNAMLILFDIDLTLVTTNGAGLRAMLSAARAIFTPSFEIDGVETAGRLDPLIMCDMLRRNGLAPDPINLRAFRNAYAKALPAALRQSVEARALPGAIDLVQSMRRRAERGELVLGLLTGNFAETGAMKLRHCGIDPDWFRVRVWGDESPNDPARREDLVPLAISRCALCSTEAPPAHRVIIIGDTTHDVAAARAHHCRCVGVATGRTSASELRSAGADLVLPDLTHTKLLAEFLAQVQSDTEDGA